MAEEGHTPNAAPKVDPLAKPVTFEVVERIQAKLSQEGELNSMEILGESFIKVNDPKYSNCRVHCQVEKFKGMKARAHPSLDKASWKKGSVIAVKGGSGFAAHSRLLTVKYRYSSTNAADIPFLFEYWGSEGNATFEIEYNTAHTRFKKLENLQFILEIPPGENPEVSNLENSDYVIQGNELRWVIKELSAESSTVSAEIKFSKNCELSDIFPIVVGLE